MGQVSQAALLRHPWRYALVAILAYLVYYSLVPRPSLHSTDGLLDVARELVLRDGARFVKLDRIVAASSAPKGSIYHHFPTVDHLLAAMWLRAVRRSQAKFLDELHAEGDPVQVGVRPAWPSTSSLNVSPADARLLAALRREDIVETVADATLIAQLAEINEPLRAATQRAYWPATPRM